METRTTKMTTLVVAMASGAMIAVACLTIFDRDETDSRRNVEHTQSQVAPGDTVATVNGAGVATATFQQAGERTAPTEGDTLSQEEKQAVLDAVIDEELLYQEALARGLDLDPKVKKVMVNTLLRQEVYGSIRNSDFTDDELEAYYEAHKTEFIVPEKIQIRRLLIKVNDSRSAAEAREMAVSLRTTIAQDTDLFKTVAAENSEDPYRRRGGDVGFVPATGKPGLDQAIVDRAFDMQVGELSEVFDSEEGMNIILVDNRRDQVERTFQQMKGSVLRKVKNERLSTLYDDYLAQLREDAQIVIDTARVRDTQVVSSRRAGPPNVPTDVSPFGPDGVVQPDGHGHDHGGHHGHGGH